MIIQKCVNNGYIPYNQEIEVHELDQLPYTSPIYKIELLLIKEWLERKCNVSVSVETGWIRDKFIFKVLILDGCIDKYLITENELEPEQFKSSFDALVTGLEYVTDNIL